MAALACLQAWLERGSPAAGKWLLYALLVALLVAVLAAAGATRRPSRPALAALGGLVGLAALAGASVLWTPLPGLARDEALLTLLYALVLAVPVLTLRSAAGRMAAVGAVAAALGVLAVATAARLRWGSDPLEAFRGTGRLFFPIDYVNAAASILLVGFWPAVAVAARRASTPPVRGLALGLAGAMLATALTAQSRGALAALALSALVVLAVCPARLRLLVPVAIAAVPSAVAFRTLTAPFDASYEGTAQLASAIRAAGGAALAAALAAAVAGLVYALVDRRLRLSPVAVRVAGLGAAMAVAGGAAVALVTFDDRVGEPRAFLEERWEAFKAEPEQEPGGTHLLSPGSNRYDFWRVALDVFGEHPVAGAGARAFGPEYLVRRASDETPARAHSLPLDVLAEHGLVGLVLLVAGVGVPLAVAFRRRALVPAAAALGAGSFWLVHAAVDWTWTFPATGVPFFLLLGVALSEEHRRLALRPRLGVAAVGVAAALLFAPTWLASRYLERAVELGPPAAAADLDRAQTLDPLGSDALVAEAQLAPSAAAAVTALRAAVEREPESVRNQYLLGLALLEAGDKAGARDALRRAKTLFPTEPAIDRALARAR